jgi:hypothetical protein
MRLMAGRCLEKLGRLVEASERLRATSQTELSAGASDAFKTAVANAEKEYKALLPRIPMITLGLSGATAAEVTITLDGKPLPSAVVGIARPVDPGHHTLRVKRGGEVVAVQEIDLKEGDAVEVPLKVKGGGDALAPAPAPGGGGAGSTQRALGWTAVGLGAAGAVFGGVTLGLSISQKSALVNTYGCTPDFVCPPTPGATDAINRYNTTKWMPTAGFAGGGAMLVTGVVLLLTAPRARPVGTGGSMTLLPWAGPQGAGVMGVF